MIAEAKWTPARKFLASFVVVGGDGAKVLEFVEEALDEIALTVEGEIAGQRHRAA
jgi:hypothetical protein